MIRFGYETLIIDCLKRLIRNQDQSHTAYSYTDEKIQFTDKWSLEFRKKSAWYYSKTIKLQFLYQLAGMENMLPK